MGRGLTALAAYENGINFVGTELNHKRLSVTLERLAAAGAKYKIETA
jgi:DNA modification methylase